MAPSTQQTSGDSAHYCVIPAPFGCLGIGTELVDGSLMISRVDYLPAKTPLRAPQNQLAKVAEKQFKSYFKNPHYQFDLPVKPTGTEHQNKVWAAVQGIRTGETKTYGEIAYKLKSGARAVGTACGANPYPLIAPCHRVISAKGIGGFMKEDAPGFYRQIKIWLLKHEGVL
jgi:methylated-DNA-[protein]-cysteine S-methyltransferase